MKKLFTLLLALVATTALWAHDFVVNGIYYKKCTKDGVMSVIADTTGWNIPAECLTVAEAREICSQLEDGATTGTKYFVKGWVTKLSNKHADAISNYGNALFYMDDRVDPYNIADDFYAYQVYGLNSKKITNPDAVAVGDYVVIYGELTNYNGTYETVGKGAAHIWKSTNPTELVGEGTMENPYTANDVLLLNGSKTGNYWVKGYIVGQVNGVSMSSGAEFDAPFSGTTNTDGTVNDYNTNILIANSADETSSDNCVPVQLPSGALRTGLNLAQNPDMDGQEILIFGKLETYVGAAGIRSPSYAKVGDKEFGVNPNVEQKEPTAKVVTIKEFIDAPESPEVYYELTGVIGGTINTKYGNFDLSDETGTVYVYGLTKEFIAVGSTTNDQSFASLGLKDGDKITLRGFCGSYKGKIEVMGAYFVELISSGNENPNPGGNGDNNGDDNGNDNGNTGTTPEGAIVFDADVDKGNAGTDLDNPTAYTISKNGVTVTVSNGILGTYNNETHYRVFKNQTLTVTSTVGNVKKVTFTCTANDDAKYGPGCFTWSTGDYTYSGANGTWTGDASDIVFTASSNQVRVIELSVVLGDGSIATYTNKIQQSEGLEQDTTNYVVVTYQNQNSNNYEGLTSINIPSEVEYKGVIYKVIGIGYDAFANNNSISSIVIPENIKNIGDRAFKGSNISSIYFESSTPPVISSITFDGIYQDNLHFYVPCGSIEAYQSVFNLQVEEYPAIYHVRLLSSENGYAYLLKNTLCEAQIEATPNYGYHFVRWSDGNTDNPRTLVLTQDTTFTAEFAQTYSGQCGDNLYWSYKNSSLTISGFGDMYNNCPWGLFENEIQSVVLPKGITHIGNKAFSNCTGLSEITIPNTVTSIGNYTFYGCSGLTSITIPNSVTEIGGYAFAYCSGLTSVTIPNSVTSIGYSAFADCSNLTYVSLSQNVATIEERTFSDCEKLGTVILGSGLKEIEYDAFKGCKKLYDIYCYSPEPPIAVESSFTNYNVNLYVPCESLRDYQMDMLFGSFKYIQCISSEDVSTEDNIVVTPGSNDVTITWPTEDEAETYSIVITKDGEVFCTLTFNNNGQLVSIAFAPGREGNHPAQYAEAAANGYRFTVTGLKEGTKYGYNLEVKDSANQTIQSYEGEFTTMSDVTTDMDNVTSTTNCQKIFRDGQLLIIRDGKTYNAQGAAL